ncbi:NUDIX hydrolase [Streptomyces lavendulae]|uniref:NUDIX hydrolase n=1 Tax=Streptomyces lavendulae TaxID=1914 RepID=UPI0031EDA083
MSITAQHVRATLDAYLDQHPADKEALASLDEILVEAGDTITSRKEFRGHVTAGAILVRPDGRVLTIEHRALAKWLLPGGHLEDVDTTLLDAALRELAEETGIDLDQVKPDSSVPLHIDAHPIPASEAKGEPEHQHFDFRFLFRTAIGSDDVALQEEEVSAYSWQFPDTITAEPLRSRILAATR